MATNECLGPVLDKAFETKSLTEILAASPSALEGVSDADAEALQKAFGIKSIADMANNKFFKAAQALQTLGAAQK